MLKIEKTEVVGWEAAIRGMRNPMNSWEQSDSNYRPILCKRCDNCMSYQLEQWDDCEQCEVEQQTNAHNGFMIGPNDHGLMEKLRAAGTDHRKFMRMIIVYLDITAPLYWWKEFKTYRAGRKFGDDEPDIIDEGYLEYDIEMNSCSTMHKIAAKKFTEDDFSYEHLIDVTTSKDNETVYLDGIHHTSRGVLLNMIICLNHFRKLYLETKDKRYWWQMIQLLPSSYNQKRTVMLNYEVLANMYKSRKNHKLDEWHTFCDWIESLPYSELITGCKNDACM